MRPSPALLAALLVAAAGCTRSSRSAPASVSVQSADGAQSAGDGASRGGGVEGQGNAATRTVPGPTGAAAATTPPGAAPPPAVTGGGGSGAVPLAGTSNPFSDRVPQATGTGSECTVDRDCVCGVERATGACAVGPAARIDTDRQCPEFCNGPDGRTRIVCEQGRCAQSR